MKFKISATSGQEPPCVDAHQEPNSGGWLIEVSDLESLISLAERMQCPLIFMAKDHDSENHEIEIYDDRREE